MPAVIDDTSSNPKHLGKYMTIESKHQKMFGQDTTPKNLKADSLLPKKRVRVKGPKKIVYTAQMNQKDTTLNLMTM